jgi:hypothetical protein
MAEAQPDPVRKGLKVFGVAVTDFQAHSMELLRRYRNAGSIAEREALLRESAELTASLHHALARIENQVLQLQSDFLMELVGREDTPGSG